MRVGGRRRIGVPPEAAFAASGGLGGHVPPNASLAYDIELVSVQ
jgi:FKBP-type peptidyl-prolyl cis-trans isomerase